MNESNDPANAPKPSEPANQPKAQRPPVRFWPYALLGSFLLVVFVAGILASDYFNYRIRLAKIEAVKKVATVSAPTVSPLSVTNATGGINNTAPAQTSDKTSPEGAALASIEVKSSEIFETYGKLLTMLLGFISVLGVFFGYFVRKSLREVEEDLRDHVALSMDLWEKEKDRLSGEVTSKLKEINRHQQQQAKLVAEFDKTLERSKKALEALEAAAKSEEQKLAGGGGRTATAAAALDADATIPKPVEK